MARERIYVMDAWEAPEWRAPWRADTPADPPDDISPMGWIQPTSEVRTGVIQSRLGSRTLS